MSRKKKDGIQLGLLCARFNALLAHCKVDLKELASFLGYANVSALQKVRKHEMFLDTEKLTRFATYDLRPGMRANIDWIFTGRRRPYASSRKPIEFCELPIELMNVLLFELHPDLFDLQEELASEPSITLVNQLTERAEVRDVDLMEPGKKSRKPMLLFFRTNSPVAHPSALLNQQVQ